jgi:ribosomal protein S27AE
MTERYVDITAPMVKKALEKVDIPVQGKIKEIHDTEQSNSRFLCIYCGAKMESGEIFCWNCGLQVFMLCPNPKIDCSGIIRMDKERCPKCGFDMKKTKEKIKEKYSKRDK